MFLLKQAIQPLFRGLNLLLKYYDKAIAGNYSTNSCGKDFPVLAPNVLIFSAVRNTLP